MNLRTIAAAAVAVALVACQDRRAADGPEPGETGAMPAVTDTGAGQTTGAAGGETSTAPPGYAGMERDTSAGGGQSRQSEKMDSFRLMQETGRDTGGHSGGEQVRGSGGEGTGAGQQ